MKSILSKRRKLTKEEREKVYDKCGGKCAYCGCEINNIGSMQVDHVIPMIFYESYQTQGVNIDSLENMLPACKSCNNYKSSLTLEKFRAAIERLTFVLQRDSVTYRNAVRFGLIEPKPHKVVFYFEKTDKNGTENI